MQHFPIFVALAGRRVLIGGGGETALAKLRLLLKTEAHITVVAADAAPALQALAAEGRITLISRAMQPGDALCCVLAYAAHDDAATDARFAALARADGALVNLVDNLADSQFITPAIVDRDPVTIAIGTEGAAPVLARAIKADLEARLPAGLGLMARAGKAFRKMAEALPMGRARRDFWSAYYDRDGPRALAAGGADALPEALDDLLRRHLSTDATPGHVSFVGAGPGDPDLLTLRARRALDEADVVIHDRLVAPEILELARREAILVSAGKEGFGPSVTQDAINDLIVAHAGAGARVVRLKSGDPTVFGRLDEELDTVTAAGLSHDIVPGITAASAAVADIGQSLTRRGRNSDLRLLTGHDVAGFAEHDWQTLARPGAVAGIYMAKKGARFLQGRLMMHGADPATDVTLVENASRSGRRVVATTLARLAADMADAGFSGPVVMLYGLAPRQAADIALSLTDAPKEAAR
jgi:uroporphyrin-III C-methyltransferase/precorrin-2 dehydrogenase/sirohydrochlorin ferrochelatase